MRNDWNRKLTLNAAWIPSQQQDDERFFVELAYDLAMGNKTRSQLEIEVDRERLLSYIED